MNFNSLFSLAAKNTPYAPVTPINGAPLTSMFFIALKASSKQFNVTTLNSKGSFV